MHIVTNQRDQSHPSSKKMYAMPKRNEKAKSNCHIDQLIPWSKQITKRYFQESSRRLYQGLHEKYSEKQFKMITSLKTF